MGFEIRVTAATQQDIARIEEPGHVHPNTGDGASAVFVDGELVAVCNEYGSAGLVPGTLAVPNRDEVETFVAAAMEFYGRTR